MLITTEAKGLRQGQTSEACAQSRRSGSACCSRTAILGKSLGEHFHLSAFENCVKNWSRGVFVSLLSKMWSLIHLCVFSLRLKYFILLHKAGRRTCYLYRDQQDGEDVNGLKGQPPLTASCYFPYSNVVTASSQHLVFSNQPPNRHDVKPSDC